MVENKCPIVGVIITAYNRAALLPRAINSVLEQTYQNFEIVVVDDASTDNTEEVVKSLVGKDGGYIQHKENLGCSTARNSGLDSISKCVDYVCFLDSDDSFNPEKLEREVRLLESDPCAGFVYSDYILDDEIARRRNLKKVAASGHPGNFKWEHFLTNEAKSSGIMYRASVVQKFRFREDLRYNEDSEFLQRIAIEERGLYSDYPGCIVYFHLWSKSRNFYEISLAVYKSCISILRDYPWFREERAGQIDRHLSRLRFSIFKYSVLKGLWGEARDYVQNPFQQFIVNHHLAVYFRIKEEIILIVKKLLRR